MPFSKKLNSLTLSYSFLLYSTGTFACLHSLANFGHLLTCCAVVVCSVVGTSVFLSISIILTGWPSFWCFSRICRLISRSVQIEIEVKAQKKWMVLFTAIVSFLTGRRVTSNWMSAAVEAFWSTFLALEIRLCLANCSIHYPTNDTNVSSQCSFCLHCFVQPVCLFTDKPYHSCAFPAASIAPICAPLPCLPSLALIGLLSLHPSLLDIVFRVKRFVSLHLIGVNLL